MPFMLPPSKPDSLFAIFQTFSKLHPFNLSLLLSLHQFIQLVV